jgi:hypothetical protein
MLRCCIASLQAQTWPEAQIIVADNAVDANILKDHVEICEAHQTHPVQHIHFQQESCYHAAESAMPFAVMDYVCFPSDDSYYVPGFAEKMLQAAVEHNWDIVYCDMVYELHRLGLGTGYGVVHVEPRWTRIDKTGFILRRSQFVEFPHKGMDGWPPVAATTTCGADGYMIEELVSKGLRHGKVPEVLVVHN